MTSKRPDQLSLRAIAEDALASICLVLSTLLVEYVLTKAPSRPYTVIIVLRSAELALVFFAAGYALRAAAYLWEQLAFLIETISGSRTWPRLLRGTKAALAFGARALTFLIKAAIAIGCLVLAWSILVYVFPDLAHSKRLTSWLDPWDPNYVHVSFSWKYVTACVAVFVLTIALRLSSVHLQTRIRATAG